jgi:hypothetical protein
VSLGLIEVCLNDERAGVRQSKQESDASTV